MNPYLGVLILDPKQLKEIPGKMDIAVPNMEAPVWVIGDQKDMPDWATCFPDIDQFYNYLDTHDEIPIPEVAAYEGTLGISEKLADMERARLAEQDKICKEWFAKQEKWEWPKDRKPKVFCYVTRFSSVMYQQARMMLKGFEKIGCETKFLSEESAIERLGYVSPIGNHQLPIIKAINEFEPDLIVALNFYREPSLHGMKIPVYTWIQDRVRNLNEDYAANIKQRDFLGFLATGLMVKWSECGFPEQQMMLHPANYDSDVFYPPENGERKGIVYMEYNASVTPYQSYKNMRNLYPPSVHTRLDDFFGRCSDIFSMGEDMFERDYKLMLQIVERDYRQVAEMQGQQYVSLEQELKVHNGLLLYNFYHDVGNRWMRQRPLVEIAKAGLPLEIYGKGWEDHPILGSYAKGWVEPDKVPGIYRKAQIVLQIQHECTFVHRAVEGLACGAHLLVKGLATDYESITQHVKCAIYNRSGEAPFLAQQLLKEKPPTPKETNVLNYTNEVWAQKIYEWIDGRLK